MCQHVEPYKVRYFHLFIRHIRIDEVHPSLWCRSVEISPFLAEKQIETVGQVNSHKSRFMVECRDASDRNGWGVLFSYFSFLVELN